MKKIPTDLKGVEELFHGLRFKVGKPGKLLCTRPQKSLICWNRPLPHTARLTRPTDLRPPRPVPRTRLSG